jgi:V/A-type H+-transporting ATPase subunit I
VRSAAAAPEDTAVPVSLRIPKLFKMAGAIFDFLNIVPAYKENDVSICVLLFLSIFFGILVGDAGYGLVFLGGTIYAKIRVKKPAAQPALNLMLLMSGVTIVWGGLGGSWFALPAAWLPRCLRGITWLTDPATKDQNVQIGNVIGDNEAWSIHT